MMNKISLHQYSSSPIPSKRFFEASFCNILKEILKKKKKITNTKVVSGHIGQNS